MSKIKILISAYACSPYHGSEPGVGWNYIYNMSNEFEIHVIVEKVKWEKEILKFKTENRDKLKNINFYFIPKKRNKFLRKIWPPSYYWFYNDWQKKVYNLAIELESIHDFDLIHQLNMVTFREPGYLHKFGKPFVWGPIGGLENSPFSYLPALGLKPFIYFGLKNIINYFDRIFLVKKRKVFRNKNVSLISATKGNSDLIKKYWHKKSTIISEIGKIDNYKPSLLTRANNSSIIIVWNGSHVSGKNLVLLLKSLSLLNIPYELNVIGDGPLNSKWKIQAQKLNLKNIIWHGLVERDKAIEIMNKCHVLCITSIYDLTSTVLIEGLSLGLPIICLNHMGFKNVVNSEIGIKIPITNTNKSIVDFKDAVEFLYNNESLRKSMARNAVKKSYEFSWENILLKTESQYKKLLNEK